MDQKTDFAQRMSMIRDKICGFFKNIGDKFAHSSQNGSEAPASQEVPYAAASGEEIPDTPWKKTCKVLKGICLWTYRLRRFIMAIPVVWFALKLADYNRQNLPEQVGLNIQVNGTYETMIERNLAIYGPLGVTLACLALMFFTRRARYPWIISVFTLVLPILIWFTNYYPQ